MTANSSHGNRAPIIRSIDTHYKGIKFRSRLEARWAIFFDSVQIPWQYETEGYELTDDDGRWRYLPDFYLPKSKSWVEVKGSNEALKEDSRKVARFLISGALPETWESFGTRKGLILLGDIPPDGWGIWLHPIIQRDAEAQCFDEHKLVLNWMSFGPASAISVLPESNWITRAAGIPDQIHGLESKQWTTTPFCIKERAFKSTLDAYRSARSARFEVGNRSCQDCGRSCREDGSYLEVHMALSVNRWLCLSCYCRAQDAANKRGADHT